MVSSVGKSISNWISPNTLCKGNPTGLHNCTVHSNSRTQEGPCALCRTQASSYDCCCSKNMASYVARLIKKIQELWPLLSRK